MIGEVGSVKSADGVPIAFDVHGRDSWCGRGGVRARLGGSA